MVIEIKEQLIQLLKYLYIGEKIQNYEEIPEQIEKIYYDMLERGFKKYMVTEEEMKLKSPMYIIELREKYEK